MAHLLAQPGRFGPADGDRLEPAGGLLRRSNSVANPPSAVAGLRKPTGMFFPSDGSLIDHAAEPGVSRRDSSLEITLRKASAAVAAPATLDGVLALRSEDGAERAFEVSANPITAPAT